MKYSTVENVNSCNACKMCQENTKSSHIMWERTTCDSSDET